MNQSIGSRSMAEALTERQPQVQMKMEHCRCSVAITHELLSRLECRLDTVCRPSPPEPVNESCKAESFVPIAHELAGIDSMQQAANARLESILHRLEL